MSNKTVQRLFQQQSLLDVLLQAEKFLDSMNLYVYPNWFKGEVLEGPDLSRYWVKFSLKYEYKDMPDPAGAIVLSKIGVKVKYEEDVEHRSRVVDKPDDLEPNNKPKMDPHKVWIVSLQIPRRFIDEADLEDLEMIDDEVDIEDISDAEDQGIK